MIFESLVTGESFGWVLGLIGAGLLLFGIGYDQLVEYLARRGWSNGRSSLLVIGGVAVTLLAAIPLVGPRVVLVLFVLFTCSGLPMAAGQIIRQLRNHRQFMQRLMAMSDGDGTG